MKFLLAVLCLAAARPAILRASEPPRVVDLKASEGGLLKATYFAAAKPGPGALLFHQSNRTRQSWNDVAAQLAAAGISTLTVDSPGHGESPRRPDKRSIEIDASLEFLRSQPGVRRDLLGVAGAGVLGVENAVEAARRHPESLKTLVLMSGETDTEGLRFLRASSGVPELFVVADDDEYPPIPEAMELLYVTASSPERKFVHYSAAHDAPWLWYEPFDIGKVPASGGHGTDLFGSHPELRDLVVDWFVTTLVRTPGHAPADTVASARSLLEIQQPGGVARVTEELAQARRKDPQAQLFPEITASTVGQGYQRAGELKAAIAVLALVVLAYPDSADAHDNLASACLADGQDDLARRHAEEALSLLDSHAKPASSWTDTEAYRGEIRRDAQKTLAKLRAPSRARTHS